MKKEKEFWDKKFKSSTIYSAYKRFLEKSKISEEGSYTNFEIKIDNTTIECNNSTEFFAKVSEAEEYGIFLSKNNFKFTVTHVGTLVAVEIKLPNESDVDEIIGIFDGILKPETSKEVNIEKTLEKHWSKNKKLTIIGIGVTIALFIIGIVVTNFGIIL